MDSVMLSTTLWIFIVSSASSQVAHEYCLGESFNASCTAGQVIVITQAHYGRMKKGKCIEGEGGRLGCYSDVLLQFDEKCSGKRACTVGVAEFAALKPCPKDFSSYLEVSYKCISVPLLTSVSCEKDGIPLPKENGYVMYQYATNSRSFKTPGSAACPWSITVPNGQKVNLTSYILSHSSSCSSNLVIREDGKRTDISLCGDASNREKRLHVSKTNHVTAYVNDVRPRSEVSFILSYKAVGCADPKTPLNGWIKRTDDVLKVKCNNSDETWYLTCADGQWVGDFDGNCTKGLAYWTPDDPDDYSYTKYAILLAVLMGVVLGVLIGALMLLVVHWYRRRSKHEKRRSKFIMVPQDADKTPDEFNVTPFLNDGIHRDPYPALITDSDIYGTKRSVRSQDRCFSPNGSAGQMTYKQYRPDCPMYHHVDGKVYECPVSNTCVKCDTQSSRYTSIDTDFDN